MYILYNFCAPAALYYITHFRKLKLSGFLLIFGLLQYDTEKKLMNCGWVPSSGEKSQTSTGSQFWDTDIMI